MKAAGAIILTISSMVMGYLVSHKFSKRVAFLEQFLQFVSYMETEIRYSSALVFEIMQKYKSEGNMGVILNEFFEIFKTERDINKAWERAINGTYKSFGISEKESEIVKNFIKNLGSNDVDGQIKHCKLYFSLIKDCLKCAKEEKRKKGKLYFMMYTSAGLCLTLALI